MAAKNGDTVKVHYTGRLDDGTVFDSSSGREPLEFTLGSGMVIPGFDAGVAGMEPGAKKTVRIPCAEAYGPVQKEAIAVIARKELPEHINPVKGMQLTVGGDEGMFDVTITDVTDTQVTMDGNHPLAGRDLTFDLELVSIK